jgi:hypothetical protein
VNPLATNLALNYLIEPSELDLTIKTYFMFTVLVSEGATASSHV